MSWVQGLLLQEQEGYEEQDSQKEKEWKQEQPPLFSYYEGHLLQALLQLREYNKLRKTGEIKKNLN